jgi:hypothetical protein
MLRKGLRRKKSQMEIMGLMIVVILLIVGVLFAVKFVVLKKPADTRQTFSRTQLASSLGPAIMSATTENCRGVNIRTLMMDCAGRPEDGGTITCDGPEYEKACVYLDRTIRNILNSTLNQWKTKYYVTASTTKTVGGRILDIENGCSSDPLKQAPGESESFFLPTDRDMLTLKVFICS